MLTKEVFKNCLVGLCKMNGVALEQDTLKMYYSKVCNDFTDDEFTAIANQILEEESLYGKFPAPVLFYKRKKASTSKSEESAFLKARQDFQDKVMEICYSNYVPSNWKEEFRKSLTPSESATMGALGDVSDLWAACRKNGQYDGEKAEYLIRRIQKEFEKHYSAEADSRLMIEESKDGEMADKINILLENLFK